MFDHAIKLLSSTECFKPLGTNNAVPVLTSFCLNKCKILQVNAEVGFAAQWTAVQSPNQTYFKGLQPGRGPEYRAPSRLVFFHVIQGGDRWGIVKGQISAPLKKPLFNILSCLPIKGSGPSSVEICELLDRWLLEKGFLGVVWVWVQWLLRFLPPLRSCEGLHKVASMCSGFSNALCIKTVKRKVNMEQRFHQHAGLWWLPGTFEKQYARSMYVH